jgi:hypothetical protein
MPGGIAANRQRTTFRARTRGEIRYQLMLLVLYAQASLTSFDGDAVGIEDAGHQQGPPLGVVKPGHLKAPPQEVVTVDENDLSSTGGQLLRPSCRISHHRRGMLTPQCLSFPNPPQGPATLLKPDTPKRPCETHQV